MKFQFERYVPPHKCKPTVTQKRCERDIGRLADLLSEHLGRRVVPKNVVLEVAHLLIERQSGD